jgi:Trk-type K+ transport system membrane component
MLLMLIGGTAGGLAGGIKLNTLVELFTGIGRSLRNELAGRLFALAAIWTLGYLLLTLVTLMLLTSFEPEAPADRLLFLAVSAVGNVGLSHDTLSSTGPSLYVLSSAMLLGRIAPLLLLWHTARTLRTTTNAVG